MSRCEEPSISNPTVNFRIDDERRSACKNAHAVATPDESRHRKEQDEIPSKMEMER